MRFIYYLITSKNISYFFKLIVKSNFFRSKIITSSIINCMSKTQNIQPLFDYVLIRPVPTERTLASGIVLPDNAKQAPQVGEVMAVGEGSMTPDGSKKLPMIVKVGQQVYYKKWGGNEVKVDREEWLLIKQEDIMAVVK